MSISGFPVSPAHLKKTADHDDHRAHTEPLANRLLSAIAVRVSTFPSASSEVDQSEADGEKRDAALLKSKLKHSRTHLGHHGGA